MRIRINRRSVVSSGRMSDRIGPESKTAPDEVLEHLPRPDPDTYTEEGIGAVINNIEQKYRRRVIALENLTRAADAVDQAALTRIRDIHNARMYGATWEDIGMALRISPSGARRLYERNGDLVGGDA